LQPDTAVADLSRTLGASSATGGAASAATG
jgi:hypothetical protein